MDEQDDEDDQDAEAAEDGEEEDDGSNHATVVADPAETTKHQREREALENEYRAKNWLSARAKAWGFKPGV